MNRLICFLLGHRYDRPEYVAGPNGRRSMKKPMYRGRWCTRCERVIDLGDLPERKPKS